MIKSQSGGGNPAELIAIDATASAGAPDPDIDKADEDVRFGMIVAGLFFVLFLGWAAFAPMDSAAYASGQLVVSGQRQSVQHRDGGVVAAIHVTEGRRVKKGDLLVELSGAEVRAQERAFATQMINLEAQRARLEAELAGVNSIRWPASFSGATGARKAEIDEAIRVQTNEFRARRSLLSAQSSVLGQQSAQAGESAVGYRSQMESSAEQERLIDEEIESLKGVAEKGFVSVTRIRALQRAKADLQGRKGQYRASVAEARASAGAGRLRQIEAEKTYRERASAELREVEFALGELTPKYRAARDQLERLRIRAPATGTVIGLNVFTEGGVIAPGQTLMDIVPDKADLVVGARVAVGDADDLYVGQEAQVRFPGLHDRNLPVITGKVTRLSADALVDEKTGESYYTAEVRVSADQMEAVESIRGHDFAMRAGAPVEVLVPLAKRTALEYAFEPLTSTMWKALRER